MQRKSPRLAILISLVSLLLCSSASAQHTLGAGSSLSVEDHARPFLVSPTPPSPAASWRPAATPSPSPSGDPGSRSVATGPSPLRRQRDDGVGEQDERLGSLSLLLDSGNLVISDLSSRRTLWQSFDRPTDTLVPSQQLTKDTTLVARYFYLYYDNDNVLRLRYDSPNMSSIYWPNPDYGVFPNGRTLYNSSRIAVLDDTGVFLSSDNLRVVASDLGRPESRDG
ncbi:unnamed protein product [Miscanthus lutarioriparius]|uniref:non-specific serine/threonine protein kinase n=1 Tax=Miscanthus lutarioriparius TaxID=422564 RepID=A0A811NML3_9POAL|nr:unnamed protein product [Miscanthus lutarioriparius]